MNITYYLSGGASNIDPKQSLGGLPSNFQIVDEVNGFLGRVTRDELTSGSTIYRCMYLFNNGSKDIEDVAISLSLNEFCTIGVKKTTEVQNIVLAGSPSGGTFTLTYTAIVSGMTAVQDTAPITYSSDGATTASNIQSALNALSLLDDVTVEYSMAYSRRYYKVTFGGSHAYRDQVLLTATSSITGLVSSTSFPSSSSGWTDSNNVSTSDNTYATTVLASGDSTPHLQTGSYGFSVPTNAVIRGFTVSIEYSKSGTGVIGNTEITMMKAGVAVGSTSSTAADWPVVDGVLTAGGASDLWGTTWTPAQVNASGFGVQLIAEESLVGGVTLKVDYVAITVHYDVVGGADVSLTTEVVTKGHPINSVAASIGFQNQSPSGVTFTTSSIDIGTLKPYDGIGVWFRRIIRAGSESGSEESITFSFSGTEVP